MEQQQQPRRTKQEEILIGCFLIIAGVFSGAFVFGAFGLLWIIFTWGR